MLADVRHHRMNREPLIRCAFVPQDSQIFFEFSDAPVRIGIAFLAAVPGGYLLNSGVGPGLKEHC